jgi:hypothetical protein
MPAPSSNVAHHRAILAGLASGGVPPDDPRYDEARRGLAAAKLTEYVERVLAEAPPLSDAQRAKLAELLRPVRVGRSRPTHIPAAIRQGGGRNAS